MAAEEGQWKGSEEERLKLLLAADAAGAEIIDVELAALNALPSRPKHAKLLVSSHDFQGLGGDLEAKIRAMFAAGADIAKVAVTPSDAADSAPLLDLPKCFPGKRPRSYDKQQLLIWRHGLTKNQYPLAYTAL
jgi:3-dehydroquinate dehydratase/shikimate dehydrogenase